MMGRRTHLTAIVCAGALATSCGNSYDYSDALSSARFLEENPNELLASVTSLEPGWKEYELSMRWRRVAAMSIAALKECSPDSRCERKAVDARDLGLTKFRRYLARAILAGNTKAADYIVGEITISATLGPLMKSISPRSDPSVLKSGQLWRTPEILSVIEHSAAESPAYDVLRAHLLAGGLLKGDERLIEAYLLRAGRRGHREAWGALAVYYAQQRRWDWAYYAKLGCEPQIRRCDSFALYESTIDPEDIDRGLTDQQRDCVNRVFIALGYAAASLQCQAPKGGKR